MSIYEEMMAWASVKQIQNKKRFPGLLKLALSIDLINFPLKTKTADFHPLQGQTCCDCGGLAEFFKLQLWKMSRTHWPQTLSTLLLSFLNYHFDKFPSLSCFYKREMCFCCCDLLWNLPKLPYFIVFYVFSLFPSNSSTITSNHFLILKFCTAKQKGGIFSVYLHQLHCACLQ